MANNERPPIKFYINECEFTNWNPDELKEFIADKKYFMITLEIEKNSSDDLRNLNKLLKENSLIIKYFRISENTIILSVVTCVTKYDYIVITDNKFKTLYNNIVQCNNIIYDSSYTFTFNSGDTIFERIVSFHKLYTGSEN
jgi:hypothetical protein